MKQELEIERALTQLEAKIHFIDNNMPPILLADLEAIVYMILRILVIILKRNLRGLT